MPFPWPGSAGTEGPSANTETGPATIVACSYFTIGTFVPEPRAVPATSVGRLCHCDRVARQGHIAIAETAAGNASNVVRFTLPQPFGSSTSYGGLTT